MNSVLETGKLFNSLKFIKELSKDEIINLYGHYTRRTLKFQCIHCGEIKYVTLSQFLKYMKNNPSKLTCLKCNLIKPGDIFGYWTVIKLDVNYKHRERLHLCKCRCGTIREVRASALVGGESKSCGCYNAEVSRLRNQLKADPRYYDKNIHRFYKYALHIYRSLYITSYKTFYLYGGRGITSKYKSIYDIAEMLSKLPGFKTGSILYRKNYQKGFDEDNLIWVKAIKDESIKRLVESITNPKDLSERLIDLSDFIKICRAKKFYALEFNIYKFPIKSTSDSDLYLFIHKNLNTGFSKITDLLKINPSDIIKIENISQIYNGKIPTFKSKFTLEDLKSVHGDKIGHFEVLEEISKNDAKLLGLNYAYGYIKCKCVYCGEIEYIRLKKLKFHKPECKYCHGYFIPGKKIHHLTVIGFDHENEKYGTNYYKFKCDCGNVVSLKGSTVKNGYTKSCGSIECRLNSRKSNPNYISKLHNPEVNQLISIAEGILRRCNTTHSASFIEYGGRGIKCELGSKAREVAESLYKIPGYFKNARIDRIDNNGNYTLYHPVHKYKVWIDEYGHQCMGNLRWVTNKENSNNTLFYQTYTIKQYSLRLLKEFTFLKLCKINNHNPEEFQRVRFFKNDITRPYYLYIHQTELDNKLYYINRIDNFFGEYDCDIDE